MPGLPQEVSRVAVGTPRGGWRRQGAAAAGVLALVVGCAGAPQRGAPTAPTFYPPPPAEPRLQYLTTLSTAADLGAVRGAFARFVLGEEREQDGLRKPYGVAFSPGRVHVVDAGSAGVATFHLGERRLQLARGPLRKPIHVQAFRGGELLVSDAALGEVVALDAAGRKVAAWRAPAPFRPGGVGVADGRLYATDLEGRRVVVLDWDRGGLVREFGGPGQGDLLGPTALALGPEDHVYVSDAINGRVQRFAPDGRLVQTIGSLGSSPGQFARPKGVAVDREGRLYVVDAAFENVQIFDPEGRLLLYFGGPAAGPGRLSLPAGIAIDYENVDHFQRYAAPGFELEYLVAVTNQFGGEKLVLFGFGRRRGGT